MTSLGEEPKPENGWDGGLNVHGVGRSRSAVRRTQWYQEASGVLPSWFVPCGWFTALTILILSLVKMATKPPCCLHPDEVTRQDGNKPHGSVLFAVSSVLWRNGPTPVRTHVLVGSVGCVARLSVYSRPFSFPKERLSQINPRVEQKLFPVGV